MPSDSPTPTPSLLKHYLLATLPSSYEKTSAGTGEMMMRRNPKYSEKNLSHSFSTKNFTLTGQESNPGFRLKTSS